MMDSLVDIAEGKLVEEALWESKEFSESLIASMQDGFSVLDNDGVHIDVNPALCRMTGFSREELIGAGPPHPYWAPEGHQKIKEAFQKTLQGEFDDFELMFMRKNGERFPVIVSPYWIKDAQGNVISYSATVKDITERKKVEETLKESEDRYHLLLEASDAGINLIGKDGTVLIMNSHAAETWGKKPEDLIGKNIRDLGGPPEFVDECMTLLKRIIETGVGEQNERFVKPLNKYFIEDIRPVKNSAGEFIGVQVMTHDITERKQAEEAVEQKMRELKTFVDNIPHMAWLKDSDSNFILANQAFDNAVGMDPEYLRSHTCAVCFGEEAAKKFKDDDRRVMEGKKQISLEETIVDKDGNEVYLETTKSPIFNEARDIVGTVGIAIDITEHKQMEEELAESYAKLEEAYRDLKKLDEMKSQFISVASHELRNPLTIIKGNIDLIMKTDAWNELDDKQRSRLEAMNRNVKHLTNMVNDMLGLSKIDAGEFSISREDVSIKDIIESAVRDFGYILSVKGQKLVADIPELPVINADKDRIRRVMVNLLDNAVKYTPDNGEISISAASDDDFIHVMIRDNGIGIPWEEQDKIFERFHMVDASTTREHGGVGLGLPIVKEIVNLHGGNVWVESTVGKGSTFHFTLPVE